MIFFQSKVWKNISYHHLILSYDNEYHLRKVEILKCNLDYIRFYHSYCNMQNKNWDFFIIRDHRNNWMTIYMLRCPEIEVHLTNNISYPKLNIGLAEFRLGLIIENNSNGTWIVSASNGSIDIGTNYTINPNISLHAIIDIHCRNLQTLSVAHHLARSLSLSCALSLSRGHR